MAKDYIDREAANVRDHPPITQAIKGGEKSICWSCFHWEVCFAKKNQPCIKCTRYIPAADVAPVVRGEWIDTFFENSTGQIVKCSVCGKFYNSCKKAVDLKHQEINPPFCMNCGADMRGEEECTGTSTPTKNGNE